MTPGILWTSEIEARLVELLGLEENLSYELIARQLTREYGMAFTKNSCIGKGRRLNMPPRPPRDYERRPAAPILVKPDAPIEPKLPKPKKDGINIYQLRDSTCRWIFCELMDPPPFRYCGRRTQLGNSYCDKHAVVVYNQPRKTWA